MGFSEHDHFKFYTGASPIPYWLANCGMISKSKEFDDVGRAVASSFPTYIGKIEATLLTGYTTLVCSCLLSGYIPDPLRFKVFSLPPS